MLGPGNKRWGGSKAEDFYVGTSESFLAIRSTMPLFPREGCPESAGLWGDTPRLWSSELLIGVRASLRKRRRRKRFHPALRSTWAQVELATGWERRASVPVV